MKPLPTTQALDRRKDTVDLFCAIVDKFIAQGKKQRKEESCNG